MKRTRGACLLSRILTQGEPPAKGKVEPRGGDPQAGPKNKAATIGGLVKQDVPAQVSEPVQVLKKALLDYFNYADPVARGVNQCLKSAGVLHR